MLGLLAVIFHKFVRELWPLIDVRIMLPLNILRNSGFLLHAKHCSDSLSILVFSCLTGNGTVSHNFIRYANVRSTVVQW